MDKERLLAQLSSTNTVSVATKIKVIDGIEALSAKNFHKLDDLDRLEIRYTLQKLYNSLTVEDQCSW